MNLIRIKALNTRLTDENECTDGHYLRLNTTFKFWLKFCIKNS